MDEELDGFLIHAIPMIRAYVQLRILTGLRQGQLLALKRSNWDGEQLTVPGAKAGHTVVYSDPGLAEAISAGSMSAARFDRLFSEQPRRLAPHPLRVQFDLVALHEEVRRGPGRSLRRERSARQVASDSHDLASASARLDHLSEQTTNRVYRRKPVETQVLDMSPSRKTNPTK